MPSSDPLFPASTQCHAHDNLTNHRPGSGHAHLIPISPTGCPRNGTFNSIVCHDDDDDLDTTTPVVATTSLLLLQPRLAVITPEKEKQPSSLLLPQRQQQQPSGKEEAEAIIDVQTASLQQELHEARQKEQHALRALQQLQEAVRIVTRQLKEQPLPIVVTEASSESEDDDEAAAVVEPTDDHDDLLKPANRQEHPPMTTEKPTTSSGLVLPCLNIIPTTSATAQPPHGGPPHCIYSNRHRTWSAGTATSNLSSAANTAAGVTMPSNTPSSSTSSVRSFCTNDELRLAQLLCLSPHPNTTTPVSPTPATSASSSSASSSTTLLPPDVAADVMNLVNAAHMVRDHAKWATMDNASLVEEMQQMQEQCHDAVQRADDMEQTCRWYQTQFPRVCQQLLRYKRQTKSLKQQVQVYQRELQWQRDEYRKCALEHHVLKALHVHEHQLWKHQQQAAKQQQQQDDDNNDDDEEHKQDGFALVQSQDDNEDDATTNTCHHSVTTSLTTPSIMLHEGLTNPTNIHHHHHHDDDDEVAVKKESEMVMIQDHHHQHRRDSAETLVTKNTSSLDDDDHDDDDGEEVKVETPLSDPAVGLSTPAAAPVAIDETSTPPVVLATPTAPPRGLGFGSAGALGFGSFQLHKSWGASAAATAVKPPLRPTVGSTKQPHGGLLAAHNRTIKTTTTSKKGTTNMTNVVPNKESGESTVGHHEATNEKNAVLTSTETTACDDDTEILTKPSSSSSSSSFAAYEPIKLLDRRLASSPLSWMSASTTPRDGTGENDLGTKVMKFFQTRGGTNQKTDDLSKSSSLTQPRLHLVEDDEVVDDTTTADDVDHHYNPEDRCAQTCCSTVSMNASLSPQPCTDHFVHYVGDPKQLAMPETPQTPFSDRGFVPLTHVTCLTDDLGLPTSTLASPKESPPPALTEGYNFRNPFSAIRCDQNVLRSLSIPSTERPHRSNATSLADKLLSTIQSRPDHEDQNGECGRLYEC